MDHHLPTLLQAALNLTGADMGTLQVAMGPGLRLVASRGFDAAFLDFFKYVEDDSCACGTALASGAPVIVEDVCASPIFAGKASGQVMLAAGCMSVVSVPITTDGRTLGMLSTHRRTRAVPTPIELARLHWLSSEAAAILEGTASGLSLRALDVLAR
ncbi:MAG: GAF domain-containing protein [Alphaproteobacteria bacterium]|nr:GAF domain-containing protein [Alphaproteobacteria bacterium]